MLLGIYGTGGSGKEVFEIVQCCEQMRKQWEDIVFIDDERKEDIFWNCKTITYNNLKKTYNTSDIQIVIAIGEPNDRKKLLQSIRNDGYELATIIHPLALISPSAVIGKGVVIQESVCISAEAHVGDNVYINGKTIIGHNVEIGENSQISSFAIIAGGTKVGNSVYIGISSAVRDHIQIGNDVIVSMGAIVMRSVSDNQVVMGNPARVIAKNDDKRVFK